MSAPHLSTVCRTDEPEEVYLAPLAALAAMRRKTLCEMCEGFGFIGRTYAGSLMTNTGVRCPDCDGTGSITRSDGDEDGDL